MERGNVEERLQKQIATLSTMLNQALQAERDRAEERVGRAQEQLQRERADFKERLRAKTTLAESLGEPARVRQECVRLREQLHQLQVSQDCLHAELETKAVQMREKDAENSKLVAELQSCRTRLLRMEIPLSRSLRLKWRQGRDMPFDMLAYPNMATVGSKLYVGGGTQIEIAPSITEKRTISVYELDGDQCSISSLPLLDCISFAMVKHKSNLVVVGGYYHTTSKIVSAEVNVWDTNQWTQPYPPMILPSAKSSVLSYAKWIVVIGGVGRDGKYQVAVQLLDTTAGRWYQAAPLPETCSQMSSCVIDGRCYLLGGYIRGGMPNRRVYTAGMEELISTTVSTGASPSPWTRLPDTPLTNSTTLVLQGSLLAVGGLRSSVIHAYLPSFKSWVKVGYLPVERCQCACHILPSGELFVIGGQTGILGQSSCRVDIAKVEN